MTTPTERLLQSLHRGGTWGYLWNAPSPGAEGKKLSAWYQVGGPLPAPANARQENYFGVHPTRTAKDAYHRSTIQDIAVINCLFAEFDAKDFDGGKAAALAHVNNLPVAPSVIVDSGGGYHGYWLLRETFTITDDAERERAQQAQYAWVSHVGSDDGTKDLARVLRLPGTKNYKYNPSPTVTIVKSDFDLTYSLPELEAEATAWRAAEKPNVKPNVAAADRIPNGARNETLTSLAGSMRRRGMSPDSITAALLAENQKRCDPPLAEREVRQVASSVARYAPTLPVVIFNHTDYGNAQRFVARHGDKMRYCTPWGKWLIWDGQRWRLDDTAEVVRLAKDTVRSIYGEAESTADDTTRKGIAKHAMKSESASRIREMIGLAESEPGIPVTPAQLDANPWLFNCVNGTISLRTGELRPHDPLDLITKMSPVIYDPDAQLDLWDSFIAWVTGDRQDFAFYLQKSIGYGLTGVTSEEKLFMLLGPEATGKSTFAEAVKSTLGDYAKTADFESFLQRSFTGGIRNDIADLAGARFVVSIEVDEGKRLAEGLVKTVTGGDTIKARHLYHEGFEFTPQFKLWLAANHAPRVNADDGALWRRIVRLPFERIIPKDKRDGNVKAYLRDPFIGGPAILAWAVKGCLLWQAEGLAEPDVIEKATEAYRHEQDPLTDFIEECCIVRPEATISRREFNAAYEAWCKKHGEAQATPKEIAANLRTRFKEGRSYTDSRSWEGICLLAPKESMTA